MDQVSTDLQLPTISSPRKVSFLQESLDILQGDKNVSLGYLLPTINALQKSLSEMNNIIFCKPLVNSFQRGLNKRFMIYMQSKMCQIAAYSDTNVDIKLLVNNYLSNGNLKSPLEMPIILKDMYIKYNTVPSSAHVERLFSAGGQLLSKKRGSMADQNFEMSLLMKFN
ncbi:Ribonuclease H-like domain, partial [Cinara cedri]